MVSQLANVTVSQCLAKTSSKDSVSALFYVCDVPASTQDLHSPNERSQQHQSSCGPCHPQELASFVRCDADVGAMLVDGVDCFDNDSCRDSRSDAKSQECELC